MPQALAFQALWLSPVPHSIHNPPWWMGPYLWLQLSPTDWWPLVGFRIRFFSNWGKTKILLVSTLERKRSSGFFPSRIKVWVNSPELLWSSMIRRPRLQGSICTGCALCNSRKVLFAHTVWMISYGVVRGDGSTQNPPLLFSFKGSQPYCLGWQHSSSGQEKWRRDRCKRRGMGYIWVDSKVFRTSHMTFHLHFIVKILVLWPYQVAKEAVKCSFYSRCPPTQPKGRRGGNSRTKE